MTPPDTNTEKQAKRHWVPLVACALVTAFGVGIILYWLAADVAKAPEERPDAEDSAAPPVARDQIEIPDDTPMDDADPQMLNRQLNNGAN